MGRGRTLLLTVTGWAAAVTAAMLALRLSIGTVWAVRERAAGPGGVSALPLADLVSVACATALGVAVLWLLLVTVATFLEVARGRAVPAVRALSPALVRRLVLTGCGVAVATATVAPASATVLSPGPDAGEGLAGLTLPDRTAGALTPPPDADVAVRTATPASGTHRVRRGETLWSIAASLLPPDAGAGDVDATWRAVYRANRTAVGDDPDVLTVGTVLHLSSSATADAPSPGDEPATPDRKDA